MTKLVGNKAKGRISKRVLQETNHVKIFRKANISYPLIRPRTYALFFCTTCFETRHFTLLRMISGSINAAKIYLQTRFLNKSKFTILSGACLNNEPTSHLDFQYPVSCGNCGKLLERLK